MGYGAMRRPSLIDSAAIDMLDLREMRLRRIAILCLPLLVAANLLSPLWAQVRLDNVPLDTPMPEPVCTTTDVTPVIIEASTIENVGSLTRAVGHVLFLSGNRRITASLAFYDTEAREGVIRDVTFTTCTSVRPDYRVVAKEVTILPNNKLHARDVSLYLGRLRVLTLPSIKLRIGGRSTSNAVFPRPGYDDYDGFTLSQKLRLADTDRARLTANLRLTTNHGLQGEVDSAYGLDGTLDDLPGRFLTYDSLRSHAVTMPQSPEIECDPQLFRPIGAAQLRAFGVVTLRQRTYDIRNEGLVLYRQPEVGFTYTGRQLSLTGERLDPRLEIYPQITGSWGRFKEVPSAIGFTTRSRVSALGSVNLLPLGPSTALQPVFYYTYSTYGEGDNYRNWAYAVDLSHLFPNGSFASGRYIKRSDSGTTPFLFDRLDIRREFQGAFQARVGRHTAGLVASYNMDTRELYEWEALYGHRTDCIATSIRWNNRLKKFSFDVTLIGM